MPLLNAKRGDSWNVTFTYTDAAGDPIQLTGADARLQVRKNSNTVLLSATVGSGLTIDEANGIVSLSTDLPQTMPIGRYPFDLEITYASGIVESTDTIYLKVEEDISRDS